MSATFFRCPTCGNPKTDDRVYRCPECRTIMCDACGYYECPSCGQTMTWKDQIGYIGER